ncbi:type II toxin-antitoxin system PemK/MazF family toxin [Dethiobacter alkaliphilus]|uniref:Transcriptional modulator of MazE/toxin, MazF n=1 Tax=Dethiobacter alkaliphilus AHT 1 TaxID=555088 RepID=C0GGW1_DETAL|nr:type II toxin-antitoxin system PemK/MazF family toxin [Dethiobacter alkaliphilus]EEG77552.1 transcriptional modulator of MazE/toxin, MazF [Dethiobacter alkaliphilus AHT 1]MCW3488857.1 type II toxin-antitoxin system PemK/MazF family toxin [Dethiobacter alkaliphilus]
MVGKVYVPCRGDIVWLDFSPQSGHEQAGRRPAVCISPNAYNKKVGLAIFCPITSNQKGYPFEVLLPDKLPIKGVVLADHLKNLDWRSRNTSYICSLDESTFAEVLGKIHTLI